MKARRRTRLAGGTVVIAVILLGLFAISESSLFVTSYLTGWVLCVMVLFLAAYNVRKAIPSLPLGSSVAWLQAHIYIALLSFVMFLGHIQFRVPNGLFETVLALIYVTVFLSGVFGLYITRAFPRRLTERGGDVIYEMIPVELRQIRARVENLVLSCNTETGTSALPEFYLASIKPFLESRAAIVRYLLFGSTRDWYTLGTEMESQRRYLSDTERSVMKQIEVDVQRKRDLDYQFALQSALKFWLFVHIPMTWALLIFVFFHTALVHAWSGGP